MAQQMRGTAVKTIHKKSYIRARKFVASGVVHSTWNRGLGGLRRRGRGRSRSGGGRLLDAINASAGAPEASSAGEGIGGPARALLQVPAQVELLELRG